MLEPDVRASVRKRIGSQGWGRMRGRGRRPVRRGRPGGIRCNLLRQLRRGLLERDERHDLPEHVGHKLTLDGICCQPHATSCSASDTAAQGDSGSAPTTSDPTVIVADGLCTGEANGRVA